MISLGRKQRDSLLFVYGTLRAFSHAPMARRLRRVARYVGVARVRGRLFDCGRYPGWRPTLVRGDWVVGDVYRLCRRADLAVFDRYEGGAGSAARFVRRRGCATLARRRSHVWLYEYRGPVRSRARILHGDYRRFVERT